MFPEIVNFHDWSTVGSDCHHKVYHIIAVFQQIKAWSSDKQVSCTIKYSCHAYLQSITFTKRYFQNCIESSFCKKSLYS